MLIIMEKQVNPEDSIIIEDAENYKAAETLGIREIALRQFERCILEGSKELKKGGIQKKLLDGKEVLIEIPNQREIYINSVQQLEIILLPELVKKEKIKKDVEELNRQISETRLKQHEKMQQLQEENKKAKEKSDERRKFFVEDETFVYWNNFYEKEELDLYKEKLILLSLLLNDLNYLAEASFKV